MKTCLICKEEKPLDQFSPNNQKRDGLHPYCKPCQSAKQRARIHKRIAAGGVPRPKEGSKWCSKCKTTKDVKDFGANRTNSDGLQAYCRPCSVKAVMEQRKKDPTNHRENSRRWKQEHPEQAHDMHLRRTYGVEYGTYAKMLAAQDGKCAICGADKPTGGRFFHMDHCHKTGVVRGLLCGPCNTGIGQFSHDVELLKVASAYLRDTDALPTKPFK